MVAYVSGIGGIPATLSLGGGKGGVIHQTIFRIFYKEHTISKAVKYLDTKEHRAWSKAIRERDDGCIVCGEKKTVAHHLIPKENIKFRSNLNNGIALCFKHHMRYGHGMSPHSHGSMLFFIWLKNNRPKILKWVEENYDI